MSPAGAASATPARPLTAADLEPVIRDFGATGVVPQGVMIELSSRAVDAGSVGTRAGDKTILKVVPDAPGLLEWTGPGTLKFTPRGGFAFGTKYQVSLEAVETRTGVVAAPSPGAWSWTFETPGFAFVRASPAAVDLANGKVNVDLTFSGPVSARSVRDHVSFQVDGAPLDAKIASTESPNVVRASLKSPRIGAKSRVRVKVRAGLPPEGKGGGLRAAAAEDSFELFGGDPVEVLAAVLKEGGNGFYVEVVCNDKASPGGQRYYWDYEAEDSYYVSRRCMLQDSQAERGIRFNPPVKFYVAPGSAGFRVFGDFKRGSYSMTIDAGLGSVDGGVTLAAFEKSFSVPARKPAVSFVSNGRYLPRSAWRNLAINHLNVDQAELTIRHVPPENLVYWMSDDYRESTDERTSNLVAQKKIALKGTPDAQSTTWVDVGSWLPADTKGVLEVAVTAEGAQRASARLLLTEMSLIAKKSATNPSTPWNEEVRVWALGMDDSSLLSGVEVKMVRKSGLVVARCTTSGNDGCTLRSDRPDADRSAPFALIATRGSDLTYLRYADLRTDVSDSDAQGAPWVSGQAYRAAIWSDRGVYRPGETAHIAAVVRDEKDVAPDAGLPVEVKLVDPREKTAKKLVLKTNEAGVVDADLPFPAFADTGSWRVELSVAEKTIGAYGFNVEEFVPERMKVTAAASKPGYAIDESVPVEIDAQYLFGGSAEGSRVELTCRLEPSSFKPKENANFSYGVWRGGDEKAKTVTLGQVTGELDGKGHTRVECPPLAGGAGFLGAARLVADAAVFEAGSGRSTNGVATAAVHPEAYYLGLATGTQKAEKGKPFKVDGIVVDWDGKPVTDAVKSVEVELYRLEGEYGYYWDEVEGDERYQRWLRPVREGKTSATVSGGRFSIDVTPSDHNDGYIVRVLSGSARTDLSLEGSGGDYYWSYDQRQVDQTPRPLKPTSLAITVPPMAKVGEPVEVKLKAPYRGKILFTAETAGLAAAEWRKAEAGEVTWSFKLKEFAPTVYVSAFLVKDPHLESKESFLPDRAFGVAPIAVEPTAYTQAVSMTVPESVRSNSPLEVTLDLGKIDKGTYATIAAVDEGILSLTRFKSPDPIVEIFKKRRLGVETYETVGWTMLLPPQKSPQRGTGGDAELAGNGRVQPVKPVALWSGVMRVPDDGKLTVSFDVPQYRGALRVMAVTAGPKKLGRASKSVTVKDPIVLSTTLPRFVTLGDELQIPVFVTNLSGKKLDVTVSLSAENLPYPGLDEPAEVGSPIQFLGKPEGRASLEDGKSATLVFQARAIKAIGAAKFRVTAKGGGHESKEELDVPFLPTGPKSRLVQRIPLEKGDLDLRPYLSGWLPTSEKSTFWVTANPYGESFDHLSYLIRYPYGCIEQTTSSTRPLLFVSNVIGNVDPTLVADQKLENMVMHGVNRVLSMQTPSGGFGYWPGDTQPSGWGSAYATHMLLDAQKAGYAVPQDRLDDVIGWMEREATRYENEGRDAVRWDWHSDTEAYIHYVLALAGKGRKARIQKLVDGLPNKAVEQQAEQKYMLQAALWLAGDRRYEKELKNPDLSPVKDTRHNSWSFYSDRRRRGFMLSTFQDLFGSDPAGEELAQTVARALAGHSSGWYTTQELVWGITGLGKRVQDSAGEFSPPVLTAGGKKLEPRSGDGKKDRKSDRTWALARASEYKSLSLNVPDKGKGNLYLLLSSEGVKSTPDYRVGGEGLTVHRTWRDVSGSRLDPDTLVLADLVYVEIEVKNTTSERIQNIALVDRLPAGFEIENPRLGRGGAIDWIDDSSRWNPDYLNIRDDRIELFGALEPGEKRTFVYAARVVTAGSFTIPPVEAEAMYDPRTWAREDGRRITVAGPWEDFLL